MLLNFLKYFNIFLMPCIFWHFALRSRGLMDNFHHCSTCQRLVALTKDHFTMLFLSLLLVFCAATYSVMTRAIATCRRLPISIITVVCLGGASQGEALVVTWAPKRKRAGAPWGSILNNRWTQSWNRMKSNEVNEAVKCFMRKCGKIQQTWTF